MSYPYFMICPTQICKLHIFHLLILWMDPRFNVMKINVVSIDQSRPGPRKRG